MTYFLQYSHFLPGSSKYASPTDIFGMGNVTSVRTGRKAGRLFFFFLTILSSLFFFPPLEESSCSYPQQEWQETAEKGNTEIAVVIPCPHGRLATETKVSGSVAVGPNACRGWCWTSISLTVKHWRTNLFLLSSIWHHQISVEFSKQKLC